MWLTLKNHYEESDVTVVHLIFRELTRAKQSDYKFIEYTESLKRAATKCAEAGEPIPEWQMRHLFLYDLNEDFEPYVFGLIQNVKTIKTKLSIDDMAIALIDHDERFNLKGSFNVKSMVTKFGNKPKSYGSKSSLRP